MPAELIPHGDEQFSSVILVLAANKTRLECRRDDWSRYIEIHCLEDGLAPFPAIGYPPLNIRQLWIIGERFGG